MRGEPLLLGDGAMGNRCRAASLWVVLGLLLSCGTSRAADPPFLRGDANGDGRGDLSDAIRTLLSLFQGESIDCAKAADSDDSGVLDVTDVIDLLGYLYQGGPAPPAPGVFACGLA